MRDLPGGGPVVKTLPSNSGDVGSIPDLEAKIPHASRPKNRNIKQKQYCNTFNKGFKNDLIQVIKKFFKKNYRRKKEKPSFHWNQIGSREI